MCKGSFDIGYLILAMYRIRSTVMFSNALLDH